MKALNRPPPTTCHTPRSMSDNLVHLKLKEKYNKNTSIYRKLQVFQTNLQ